ncbi:MAG: hypothetical protein PHN38_05280 [Sulfurospirillaceae bacterium]|nr:hypothetical protein [Sulfurospirillaceae bacterium]MDD3462568.1 hypothetical protein [Sulfurospirillaceae bacterium]
MVKNGIGGANTQTGAIFENEVDIIEFLATSVEGYSVVKHQGYIDILFNNECVAKSFRKHQLYKYLDFCKVDWKKILSKKLLPDEAIYVIKENTVFIIEMKSQVVAGSVDEKLQTCGFKLIQYKKLFAPLNYEVEYLYILNDWFKKPEYQDVLDYIIYTGCKYYFNYLPLHKIGLPIKVS